jgi:hypothetical protein
MAACARDVNPARHAMTDWRALDWGEGSLALSGGLRPLYLREMARSQHHPARLLLRHERADVVVLTLLALVRRRAWTGALTKFVTLSTMAK